MADNFDPLYGPQPSLNSDGLRKFSDVMLERCKNEIVEVYIGDQYETIEYEGFSQPQNATIFGRVIDILDRFIVLNCFYVDQATKEVKHDHVVFINSFQIRAMTIIDGKGSLDDIFLSTKDVSTIKKYLHLGKK